jgi:hypothetical protein
MSLNRHCRLLKSEDRQSTCRRHSTYSLAPFVFHMSSDRSSNRRPDDMPSLDAYWLQEVEVQKMDEELGKEVLTLLALLVQKYEY